MDEELSLPAPERARVEKAAVAFLTDTQKWKRHEFRLEHQGVTDDYRCAVVWGVYLQDEINPMPGGGQSLELHIDRNDGQVVQVLRFQ